jgi:hydroxyethylthiazole kinase-like uncharacterized protein yjeF
MVTPAILRDWPLPTPGDDKEGRGRILVIGGSRETPGAVLLAGEAALRAGAGKLQIATVASMATPMAVAMPEALVRALPESETGAIAPSAMAELQDLVGEASAVLIGPGLMDKAAAGQLVLRLLEGLEGPVVLDALALAAVELDPDCLRSLKSGAVLTPNNRELAATLEIDETEAEERPRQSVCGLVARAGAVVTSGGAASWTADLNGGLWVDQHGGRGLGVSGSGDVRAGIVAGLLARGAEPAQAAVWGTHLHKRAGDRLAGSVGHLGFLARELLAEIPRVLTEIEG